MPNSAPRSTLDIEPIEKGRTVSWEALLQVRLSPEERLLSSLQVPSASVVYVPLGGPFPNVEPMKKESPESAAVLALTDRRLLVGFRWGKEATYWFSTAAVLALAEVGEKAVHALMAPVLQYPYAADLHLPGGMVLKIRVNLGSARAKELQTFLDRVLFTLGRASMDDNGATVTIVAHEAEEEERRRRND